MTESVDEPAIFHEGIRLFNAQDWFEAHEVWEDIWREASGDRKRFYQGLIQCAVTIEHVRRGNPRGVLSVWTTAQTKFTGLPSPYMGIAVDQLLADVKALIVSPTSVNSPIVRSGPAVMLTSTPLAP